MLNKNQCIMNNNHFKEDKITRKLLVKFAETDQPHPYCPHGATLLFYYAEDGQENGYYSCAAHRDKRMCNFHLNATELTEKKLEKRYEMNIDLFREQRLKLLKAYLHGEQCHYCFSCDVPFPAYEVELHALHEVLRNLTKDWFYDPTQFLRPLDDDKVQAQYFFDSKALHFFFKCFRDLGINKVICMGAPRLHTFLLKHCADVSSFLLDFDQRFLYFLDDEQYAWYNMCNNHFFDETQQLNFHLFLKCQADERLLIFTDPPFGCRTEAITHTLHQITKLANDINQLPHQPLPIFWIFPYFAERYIQQQMPEMQMCDYKVNYTNHLAYTDHGVKSRKLGSPVRIFTNVPLELIQLPVEEQYKYCVHCAHYTALENRHCDKCATCPSKNGATYRHCQRCGICVKPNYVHCAQCRRCTQVEGHNCQEYQLKQRCWICLKRGHIERNCTEWQRISRKRIIFFKSQKRENVLEIINCLLCNGLGHNEQLCPQRAKLLEENTFMGETQVSFKV